ncbi:S15/NS1 RNA-binding protein [Glarea lozoyensis ATCC 20868]|uniref:S15/NS1 RNA-binding protein n=1 Tax=Glarea lozoyensis (strain ATCC 20868 / MF5171) TaxID=1116229 RepID=S3DBN7_GLAL2|nr:S15/NS1 RNA-binding protein [Glarea lozoyensis ATCC 20868]EPE35837.1 S15/NS1 RNA-binding protein [Glarea lozoyensis ATCC 20868]
MPPRIPIASRSAASSLCIRPAPSASTLSLPIISTASVSTFAERKAHKDPYALAQSAQRKAVNLARQKVLQAERKQALGDPVRGITTPFVQSFDSVGGSAKVKAVEKDGVVVGLEPTIETDASLGYFLTPEELKKSLDHSYSLAEPFNLTSIQDPVERREIRTKYEDGHQRATVALTRIVSLANASQEAKTRANKQRCIETFGRHRTDGVLRPRAPVNPSIVDKDAPQKTPRAGPDTGSSEVQIAILTAKIKVLADQLEKKGGNKDKVNKRNLRIMVHKRQKHLNYLRRKERGSDRWQNLISTLGLTEGTYKGEISL